MRDSAYTRKAFSAAMGLLAVSCVTSAPGLQTTPPKLDLGTPDIFDKADRTSPGAQTPWYCFYDMPTGREADEFSACQRTEDYCNWVRDELVRQYPSTPKSSCVLTAVATKRIFSFSLIVPGGERGFGFFSRKACGWWVGVFEDSRYRHKWTVRNDCHESGAK